MSANWSLIFISALVKSESYSRLVLFVLSGPITVTRLWLIKVSRRHGNALKHFAFRKAQWTALSQQLGIVYKSCLILTFVLPDASMDEKASHQSLNALIFHIKNPVFHCSHVLVEMIGNFPFRFLLVCPWAFIASEISLTFSWSWRWTSVKF